MSLMQGSCRKEKKKKNTFFIRGWTAIDLGNGYSDGDE